MAPWVPLYRSGVRVLTLYLRLDCWPWGWHLERPRIPLLPVGNAFRNFRRAVLASYVAAGLGIRGSGDFNDTAREDAKGDTSRAAGTEPNATPAATGRRAVSAESS